MDIAVSDRPTDTATAEAPETTAPWKLLIVDDEPDVHALTKLLLRNFTYRDRGLEFLSAHTATEAKPLLAQNPDIALVLLDVVMETEHAGIELVNHIREELGNRAVQIVIRTGQPGQAPPLSVVSSHSINDYKEKTELTQQSMLLTVVKALRLYEEYLPTYRAAARLDELIERARAGTDDRELLRALRGDDYTGPVGNHDDAVPVPAAVSDPRLSSLTEREREVLKWLSHGDSNKAIGLRLGVQEVTVKAHLRQIFAKLQVFNRTQAASLALRMNEPD
jgi:DNA-binding NarL/FixJ family response regulator